MSESVKVVVVLCLAVVLSVTSGRVLSRPASLRQLLATMVAIGVTLVVVTVVSS